jgi:hypothetical protein
MTDPAQKKQEVILYDHDHLSCVLRGQERWFLRLLIEKDKQYEQRYKAQQIALTAALTSQEKAVNAALAATDRAVSKAEVASDKRFESVNEFRGNMSDMQATLMPRAEAESRIKSLEDKLQTAIKSIQDDISPLKDWIIEEGGGRKRGESAFIRTIQLAGIIIALATGVGSMLVVIFKK